MCRGYSGWGCGPDPYPHHHMGPWRPAFWGCCYPLSKEEEVEQLKSLKNMLERRLHEVEKRMERIEKEE